MTAVRWVHREDPTKMLVSFDQDQNYVYTWDREGIPTRLDRRDVEKSFHLARQAPFEPTQISYPSSD